MDGLCRTRSISGSPAIPRETARMNGLANWLRGGMLSLLAAGSFPDAGRAQQSAARPTAPTAAPVPAAVKQLVHRYCLDCHNRDDHKAGLALDSISSDDVSRRSDVWEKVVRKLAARQMPPAEMPRPPESEYVSAVAE